MKEGKQNLVNLTLESTDHGIELFTIKLGQTWLMIKLGYCRYNKMILLGVWYLSSIPGDGTIRNQVLLTSQSKHRLV